ncbi:HVO_A0114 family putative DNA-binding protein [Paraburkholderia terrae]
MRTVTLGVSSREEISARFVAAFKGNAQGAHISFASHELLFQTLTPLRWSLIRAVIGAGPLSIREIARRVARDVKGVHRDVHALLNVGILERNADGTIEFPYDVVHVDFVLKNG